MSDGTMTFFCSVCDEVSITVHSEWEANERYAWERHPITNEWICDSCIEKEFEQRQARKLL